LPTPAGSHLTKGAAIMTKDVSETAARLLKEIVHDRDRYLRYARGNYAAVRVFFWSSAIISVVAAVWGFTAAADPKVIGALAALSALTGLISRQAGLQQRANTHYRRVDRLKALVRELEFGPEPTQENIDSLVAQLNLIERDMTQEFEQLDGEASVKAAAG
jgi:hypothetical protein